jgi:very-short-patch-repair endonuclease
VHRRLKKGRLHLVRRGVYAVGRPELTGEGHWLAAILACGMDAVLSLSSAANLWGIRPSGSSARLEAAGERPIHVSTPRSVRRRPAGVLVHRPTILGDEDVTTRDRIPVTTADRTLLDLGTTLSHQQLVAAVNRAGKEGLVNPERLRSTPSRCSNLYGAVALRRVLEREDFVLTSSELQRLFIPFARRAGLTKPLVDHVVNGFEVDFFWPELGLVVETDGLQWHRTPAQQAKDRQRDQAHSRAGLTPLRFTHWQVAHDPEDVIETLRDVARRLWQISGQLTAYRAVK